MTLASRKGCNLGPLANVSDHAPSNMHWLSSQADLVAPARTDLKK